MRSFKKRRGASICFVIIIPTQSKVSPVRLCQNSNGSVPHFVGKVKQTSHFSVTRHCRFVVFRTTISSCAHFVKRTFSDNHSIFQPFSMLQNKNCVYLADKLFATCKCILLPDRPRKRPPDTQQERGKMPRSCCLVSRHRLCHQVAHIVRCALRMVEIVEIGTPAAVDEPSDLVGHSRDAQQRRHILLHLRFADLKPILFTSEVYVTSILNVDRSRAQGRQSQLRQGAK